MKGIIITHPGIEAVSAKEVKELIGCDVKTDKSVARFETGKIEDFCLLCYRMQSAVKVLAVLAESSVKKGDIGPALKMLKDVELSDWLERKTFAVRAKIIDNDLVDTLETEREVGEVIFEKYKAKVNLSKPDVTFFVYVCGDVLYFGVDFAGFDLSKRAYRVFDLTDSIKGTMAFSLLRIAGYKPDKALIDPFCHSGSVCIEAAFFASKKSVHFYGKDTFAFLNFPQFEGFDFDRFFAKLDKFDEKELPIVCSDAQQRHVKSAEKNAKIAGLNKVIRFSRMDVEWLDTKFEKQSMDMIVSNPPRLSRLMTAKGIDKVFQELFYTADFILKKTGKIVLLVKSYNTILNQANRYNFSLKANFEVMQGQESLNILVFERKE